MYVFRSVSLALPGSHSARPRSNIAASNARLRNCAALPLVSLTPLALPRPRAPSLRHCPAPGVHTRTAMTGATLMRLPSVRDATGGAR